LNQNLASVEALEKLSIPFKDDEDFNRPGWNAIYV